MKRLSLILIILAALTGSQSAIADEGMWMINAIDAALEKKMQERGLELSAKEIYNADAPGATVADAVVSMEFGCTGSMISDQGLLITNHHCAYGDVHALSTPEHNYLEEGFWAMRADEEVNIKDKSVYFLKRVIDVTDEVHALQEQLIAEGKPSGMRRLSHLMEQKYSKESGLEAWLSSMWRGSKYYMALYEVYKDVRLVAAPPVSSAAFGGDIDNWEWPQHKCDFALYRVYTAPDGSPAEYSSENVPMKPVRKLSISLDGYKEGDYTMVIGYPGTINRYSSSFETDFDETLNHPVNNAIRGRQMEIIKGWMDKDPDIRLKYSDYFFSLSNVQELYCGQVLCYGRFDVVEKKAEIEIQRRQLVEETLTREMEEKKGRARKFYQEKKAELNARKAAAEADKAKAYETLATLDFFAFGAKKENKRIIRQALDTLEKLESEFAQLELAYKNEQRKIDTAKSKRKQELEQAAQRRYPIPAEPKKPRKPLSTGSYGGEMTPVMMANMAIKQAILDGMEPGVLYTVSDIIENTPACFDLTNQRVSALLRQMVGDQIERVEDRRMAYFRLME